MVEKRVMLVTGTSKGIGRHLAEYYLARGFIVIGCSRGESAIISQDYQHYCLDVDDENSVKLLFKDLNKNYGRLDFLLNNAGTASMNHSLLMPISSVRRILDTNIIGTFLFSREAAKLMKKNHFGRIVNFVTFAIPFRLEGEAIYAASKAAVVTLTQILSREYASYGITVNAVAPPAVQTDLIRGVDKKKLDALLKRQAINRYGTPDKVSSVIDFYLKAENDMVTGEVIYMGGI